VTASQKPRRTDEELWAELCALPEHVTGQIIDGELLVQPRPRPRHARVIKRLGRFLSPTDDGDGIEGGQGGWWILIEPGIELPGAPEIVPDLAGWRRSTMPEMDWDAPLRVCPAWACEVLSPSNTRTVILKKQKVYARSGVEWLWLVNPDPLVRSQQVFRSTDEGLWLLCSTYSDEAAVRIPPFEEVELPLTRLWL
jgi:Uma2 family endonuclease